MFFSVYAYNHLHSVSGYDSDRSRAPMQWAPGSSKEFASMSVMSFITAVPSLFQPLARTTPLLRLPPHLPPLPATPRWHPFCAQSLDISVALSLFSATLGESFVCLCATILRLSRPRPVFCFWFRFGLPCFTVLYGTPSALCCLCNRIKMAQ